MNHFTPEEFLCKDKCGLGIADMNPALLKRLDLARELIGIPIIINSAIRCPKHNEDVGGSPTSSHLTGDAVDIAIYNDRDRYLVWLGLVLADIVECGAMTKTQAQWAITVMHKEGQLSRFGFGESFIHADVDSGKTREIIWTYSTK